uniref:Uncharacterized protein n=1 Tax=Timema bartmani TaxID=61472 RepID=A0A7R9I5A9_9NEOP|nr:unnamed protein product [Timema bartmani]
MELYGFYARVEEIKLLISSLHPSFLCLQETHFRPADSLMLRGYYVLNWRTRQPGRMFIYLLRRVGVLRTWHEQRVSTPAQNKLQAIRDVSISCVIFSLGLVGFVYQYRKVKVFKVASPIFLGITLIGCAIMYLEAYVPFYVADVSGESGHIETQLSNAPWDAFVNTGQQRFCESWDGFVNIGTQRLNASLSCLRLAVVENLPRRRTRRCFCFGLASSQELSPDDDPWLM